MAQEFGYDIVFKYRGNDGLTQFQKDAGKVQATLAQIVMQARKIKQTTKAVQELTRTAFKEADRDAISASKVKVQLYKQQEQLVKKIGSVQKNEAAKELARQKKLQAVARGNLQLERERQRNQQLAAAAAQRLSAAQERASRAAIRANRIQARTAKTAEASSNRARRSAEHHGNAITGAISRTVRFFLLFKTLQEGIQLVSQSITGSINFAALLEESEKQIAGLILSVGEVRDVFGETVDAAEGLPTAMGLARSVLRDLQTDAVLTAATFRELVQALQVSIAPGLANGLDVDQVRKLTVTFSQAATALGIAQRDLAEEIRSTLQGTISTRNTRIAVALGITNDDIKKAKEAGELYEFLQGRMAGVASAAKSLQTSLTVLRSNFQDVLEIAGGAGMLPVFESLKGLFSELIDLFTTGTLEDGVKIDPKVIATIEAAGLGLRAIVDGFREFIQTEDARDTVVAMAEAFGDLGKAIGDSLPEFLRGLSAAFVAFTKVLGAMVKVVDILGPGMIELLTTMAVLSPVMGKFAAVLQSMAAAAAAFTGSKLLISLVAIGGPIAALVASVALAAYLLRDKFAKGADLAAEAAERAKTKVEEYARSQQELVDSVVTTGTQMGVAADRMDAFASSVEEAARKSESFGKTGLQVEQLERRLAVEEALAEIRSRQITLEKRYEAAQKSTSEAIADLPERLQRLAKFRADLAVAVAQQERREAQVAALEKQEDRDLEARIELDRLRDHAKELKEERLKIEREYQDELKSEYLKGIDEQIELARRAALSAGAFDRPLQGGPAFKSGTVAQGEEELKLYEELIRKKAEIEATAAGDPQFLTSPDARALASELVNVANTTQDISQSLIDMSLESRDRLETEKHLLDLSEQEEQLKKQLLQIAASQSDTALQREEKALKALKDQLELEKQRTDAIGDRDRLRNVDAEARLQSRQRGIQDRILEVEKDLAVVRESGGTAQTKAVKNLEAVLAALREQLAVESEISGEKVKQGEKTESLKQKDDPKARLARLQRELDVRRKINSIDASLANQRASADIASIQARTAEARYQTSRKQVQIDILASQFAVDGLRVERDSLITAQRTEKSESERIKNETDILDLNRAIVEEQQKQRVLAAEIGVLEQDRAEQTEAVAGFKQGLTSAIESREAGRVFSGLAETLAGSLENGISEALLSGDVTGSIDNMANYMKQAVVKALVSAYIVNPFLDFLGSFGTAASAGGGAPVIPPLLNGPPRGQWDGGPVGSPNMSESLPGHHPNDTTLIAAAQGEYVLPVSLTRMLGSGFLDGLRSMTSSASEMRYAMMSRLGAFNRMPIKPYAGGGPVGSSSPQVSRSATAGAAVTTPLLVVTRDKAQTIMNNPTFSQNMRTRARHVGNTPEEYA